MQLWLQNGTDHTHSERLTVPLQCRALTPLLERPTVEAEPPTTVQGRTAVLNQPPYPLCTSGISLCQEVARLREHSQPLPGRKWRCVLPYIVLCGAVPTAR